MATPSVTGSVEPQGPLEAPPAYSETRTYLAAQFLRGSGLEIGAMNWPLAVPPDVHVTYVDHMNVEDQRARAPGPEDRPRGRDRRRRAPRDVRRGVRRLHRRQPLHGAHRGSDPDDRDPPKQAAPGRNPVLRGPGQALYVRFQASTDLARAPDRRLRERPGGVALGALPGVGANGVRAWDRAARPSRRSDARPPRTRPPATRSTSTYGRRRTCSSCCCTARSGSARSRSRHSRGARSRTSPCCARMARGCRRPRPRRLPPRPRSSAHSRPATTDPALPTAPCGCRR